MRDSFVFYRSFWEAIKELPIEIQSELLPGIIEYGLNRETKIEFSHIAKAMFTLIKPQLDANFQKYLNGKKGGAPVGNDNAKQPENNLKTTKKQPKDKQKQRNANDNDNDNVNENDNDNAASRALVEKYKSINSQFVEMTDTEIEIRIKNFINEEKPLFIDPYLDLLNLTSVCLGFKSRNQLPTKKRNDKLKLRLNEPHFDFIKIIEAIKRSEFLQGKNDRGWKIDMDFILENGENYQKILEGKYE